MTKKYSRKITMMFIRIVVLAFILANAGLINEAQAQTAPSVDSSCFQLQSYGFTAGLVYCVQASIDTAVTQYVGTMQSSLRFYEGMMASVAIIIFGYKLMHSGTREPVKETLLQVMRIAIGVFFYENAVNLYHWIAGTASLGGSDGIMNEAIGWITGTGPSGGSGSGNMFSNLISSNCTTSTPPVSYQGLQVWQAFDCMFMKIMGAADPTQHPYAFATSMISIIAASIFSATAGISVAVLGVTLFINAMVMIFRALYLVLISYFCVGLMTVFAPFVAPMIFFESEFLTSKFMSWLSLIVSCIFQPVLVIGFLAMAVCIDDQLIEGNMPNCTLPTYFSGTMTVNDAPPGGFGQDGSGVCSFTQLFNKGISGEATSELQDVFHSFMQPDTTLFSSTTNADPQLQSPDGSTQVDPTAASYTNGITNVMPTQKMQANAADVNLGGVTRLKNYVPLKQFMLTLLTFIFVTYALNKLMEIIPSMASNMTLTVGVSLLQGAEMPFEKFARKTLSTLEGGAKNLVKKPAGGTGNVQSLTRANNPLGTKRIN